MNWAIGSNNGVFMNEELIIWGAAGFFVLVMTLPPILKFRKQKVLSVKEREEAVALGINKPIAQFPIVNQQICIGCGSCIDACPEGGVLALVSGKAAIVNGIRCIGHGECAMACPVEGITMGLGDLSKREDIPSLDGEFETNIPGLFVIGELGGMALIRNAIIQGSQVVKKLAEGYQKREHALDLCIVGAGPAGLTAALAAKQEGLSFCLIDQQKAGGTILQYPKKKLVLTQPVEIPLYGTLKKREYRKEELLDIWNDITREHEINVCTGHILQDVQPNQGGFIVTTQLEEIHARQVILALGRRGTPRKLGIPGEKLPKVFYKLIDASIFKDNAILIVGGGDSAVEAAMALARQKGNHVTIAYRKHKFFRTKKRNMERLEKTQKKYPIDFEFNTAVVEICDSHVVLKTGEREKQVPNDFVFIFAGGIPPFQLLKKAGITFGGHKS